MTASATGWREPTSLIPLRWGTYRGRYLAGMTLIISGLIGLQGANNFTIFLLLWGTVAHATGWLIMPSGGIRRVIVVVPCVAQIWLLLPGPQTVTGLAVPFASWLLVRHRPPRTYITLLLVLGMGVVLANLFHNYSDMPLALSIGASVVVGSAWLARYIAEIGRIPSKFAAPGK
jgi:hypothetical protein